MQIPSIWQKSFKLNRYRKVLFSMCRLGQKTALKTLKFGQCSFFSILPLSHKSTIPSNLTHHLTPQKQKKTFPMDHDTFEICNAAAQV